MPGTHLADRSYFAFTMPLSDEGDWLSSSKPKPPLRGLYWALLVSLVIHLLFFQWQPPVYDPETVLTPTKSLHLTLHYPSPPEHLPRQPVLNAEPVEEAAAPSAEQQVSTEASDPVEPVIEPDIPPEPLDDQALGTAILHQNRYRDAYMPTTESNTEFSTGVVGSEQTPSQFNNVFDPRLRARLQNNPVRSSSQQASGPTGLKNIYGTTLVELDNGSCMSSTLGVSGQPTNWYLTACGGKKSESEQMMERVNRDFQNRR